MADRTPALVLGIGNLLWADEGFGVRCVEALNERFELPEGVRAVDGGTQGLYLVPLVSEAERVLVFDALDWGVPPGTIKVIRDDEVPRFHGAKKMSLHQVGFQDVLSATQLLDAAPARITLIGVQLAEIDDFGGSLSPQLSAALDRVIDLGVQELASWGFPPRPRARAAAPLFDDSLRRKGFEEQRPGTDVVCREGDARFLNLRAARRE